MTEPATKPPPRQGAAIVGTLACLALLASYVLPWIVVPPEHRARLEGAYEPGLRDLEARDPATATLVRRLVEEARSEKGLDGLDLFLFARTAKRLNESLEAASTAEPAGRALLLRRAFSLGGLLLAALPPAALALLLHFVLHGWRRARAPVLVLLVVLGVAAAVPALGWRVLVERTGGEAFAGRGLDVLLAASAGLACAGILGVTVRTWWRVYLGAVAAIGSLAVLAWAYVVRGVTP